MDLEKTLIAAWELRFVIAFCAVMTAIYIGLCCQAAKRDARLNADVAERKRLVCAIDDQLTLQEADL